MKTQTIVLDNDDVMIICPCCKNESWDNVDQPRHKFPEFEVVAWEEDIEGGSEISIMKCVQCGEKFRLIWDYGEKVAIL